MINIDFTLLKIPSGNERYRLLCDTEGKLVISNEDGFIFSHDGILLAEFARVLGKWLENNNNQIETDFVYNSMDFEEEPILAFRQSTSGKLIVESSLVPLPVGLSVQSDELIEASKIFLKKLHRDLLDNSIAVEKYDAFPLPT